MTAPPETILVIGGNGGLGRALVANLQTRFPTAQVFASHHRPLTGTLPAGVLWQSLDVADAEAIDSWSRQFKRVDWIINAAGYLHGEHGGPEKSIRAIDSEFLLNNFRINTLPTLLLAKSFAGALRQSPAPILATLSARVGSIEDNWLGGWYAYRCSKAALNMALKTLSIEWRHSHPRGCVAALHPGTNDTALSRPFQANVAAVDLFDPADTAAAFVDLLARLKPADSGRFWAWNGEQIPW